MIEILSNGALNLVQDLGRFGHVGLGVSPAGAMDAPALTLANWMVGNDAQAAGVEISIFPFRLRVLRPTRLACTGASTRLELRGRKLPSWWAAQAQADDLLVIAAPQCGSRAYLALAGGIDVPRVLSSRSTDLKSGFGGLEGRGLRKGDRLSSIGAEADGAAAWRPFGIAPESRLRLHDELATGTVAVRVLAGAEYAQFDDEAHRHFEQAAYKLTPDCNRQGFRLDGPALKTTRPLELLSHGLLPGTVQVPPSGQPIVQMTEANTCGGYPKIAKVIAADLWRLAQLRPGQSVRFQRVEHADAVAALREQERELGRIRHGLSLLRSA
jgi:biotin-dependent carboxylase-like uncharacterized protein